MEADRYERVASLFARARQLAPEQRAALLDQECGADLELRREVEELLASDSAPNPLLEDERIESARAHVDRLLAEPSLAEDPESISGYRILRRIGAGGMGIVYEAEQESPRRRVALKVLPPGQAHGDRLRRFRRESQLLGSLHHPGIASVHEAGTAELGLGEQHFFAMELVEGSSLTEYAHAANLDVRGRLELLAKVCDAVQHAHERGIVHRDLKPDNVLVDERGQPKVLDFGIALARDVETTLTTMQTAQGELIGTLTHMAPEQLRGEPEAIGPPCDIYSMGVIAFELLTGRLPHELAGLPVGSAIRRLVESEAPRLSSFDTQLRGDLETIIGKAMSNEAVRRYASPAALAADLRRYLGSEPISARPPSATYRARRFVQRHPGPMVGALVSLVATIAGFSGVLEYAKRESAARERAQSALEDAERSRVKSQSALYRSLQLTLEDDPWRVYELLAQVPHAERGWEWGWLMRQAPFLPEFPWARNSLGILQHARMIGDRTVVPYAWDVEPNAITRCVDLARPTEFVPGGIPATTEGVVFADRLGWTRIYEDYPSTWSRCAVYDRSSGAVLQEFPEFSSPVKLVGYVEGGPMIALNNETQTVTVHPSGGGPPSFAVERSEYFSSQYQALSKDGRLLFVTVDATHLQAIDTVSQEIVWETSLVWWPKRVRYDPHGERIGIVEDRNVRLLDARTGEQLLAFQGPESGGSRDEPHIAFAREASVVAIQREDGKIAFFDADTGETLREFGPRRTNLGYWPRIDLSPSGRFVSMAALHSLAPWIVDLQEDSDPTFTAFEGAGDFVYWLALSLDGGLLAAATYRGEEIVVWDAWSGELLSRVARGSEPADGQTGLQSFSSDGRHLVYSAKTEGHGHHVARLDLLTGAIERGESAPWRERHNVPSTYSRELVRLTGREAPDFNGRIAAHPEGERLYLALPQYFYPQQLQPLTHEWELDGITRWHTCGIDVSADGELLALGMKEDMPQSVVVVRTDDGSRVAEIEAVPGGETLAVAWSPDGERLAIGLRTGEVRLYETRYWTNTMTLPRHGDYVLDLVWSPDGELLYSGSGDGTVRLWDTKAPIVRRFRIEDRAAAAAEAAGRLAAWTAELGSHDAAAERLWEEAGDDDEARIAVQRACLEAWRE